MCASVGGDEDVCVFVPLNFGMHCFIRTTNPVLETMHFDKRCRLSFQIAKFCTWKTPLLLLYLQFSRLYHFVFLCKRKKNYPIFLRQPPLFCGALSGLTSGSIGTEDMSYLSEAWQDSEHSEFTALNSTVHQVYLSVYKLAKFCSDSKWASESQ